MKLQNEYLLRSQLNLQKIIGAELTKNDNSTLHNIDAFKDAFKTPLKRKSK